MPLFVLRPTTNHNHSTVVEADADCELLSVGEHHVLDLDDQDDQDDCHSHSLVVVDQATG